MPNDLKLIVTVKDHRSPRLRRLATSLQRMARALEEMSSWQQGAALSTRLASEPHKQASLAAGRYERATDDYQAQLLDTYDAWVKRLQHAVGQETDLERAAQVIVEKMPALREALHSVAQEFLPDAVNAMSDAYVPSADAYRLIGDAITQNNGDVETRLVPAIEERLLRAVLEGTDLAQAAESMSARVAAYAGAFWVLIQRLIGDYVQQMQTADDQIYPCEWFCVGDENSCESCLGYAGIYESYAAMLEKTDQCVPGYFFNTRFKNACWGYCRCYLRIKIKGKWVRI